MDTIVRTAPFVCASCEAEVSAPVFHVGVPFCCAGCVAGGPCTCSYDQPPQARAVARASWLALPSSLALPRVIGATMAPDGEDLVLVG